MNPLNNYQQFNIEAQKTFNKLINIANEKYEINEVYELSYCIGSALSSSFYNILKNIDDDNSNSINQIYNKMIQALNEGMEYKHIKNEKKEAIIIEEIVDTIH